MRFPAVAIGAGVLSLIVLCGPAWAASTVVAFPRVTGPKPAGRGPVAEGVIEGLEKGGLQVRRGEPLRAAAEELETSVYDLEVAVVADCDYLLLVELAQRGRGFLATARILRTEDGEELQVVEHRYSGKRAAVSAGRAVAEEVAELIREDLAQAAAPEPRVRERGSPSAPSSLALAQGREKGLGPALGASAPAPRGAPGALTVPGAELDGGARQAQTAASGPGGGATAGVETERAPPPSRLESPERAMIRLSVGVGSRLFSAYSVLVDGEETGLGYTLDPLLAADARGVVAFPGLPFGIEVDFAFRPVAFQLSTDPAVVPSDPRGQVLDIGGSLWWRFDLNRWGDRVLTLTPLLGLMYASLSAEEQGPATLVTSWSSVAVDGGLRLGLEIGDRWAFDAETVGGAILSFSEAPTTTGERGEGFRVAARLRGRHWFLEQLGAELSLGFDHQSISTFGLGSRAPLDGDPELRDAALRTEALDVGLAALVAI